MKPPVFSPDWPDDVRALYRHDLQEIWDPNISRHIWNQYHNQLELYLSFASIGDGLRILDIGCAQATLALLLAEQGHQVCAIDIRQRFLDYAATRYERGKISFIAGNAMQLNLSDRFDLIFANQIIEHLVYPLDFIKHIAGWLAPSGRLILTTPNWHYLRNNLPSYSELGDPSEYQDRQFTADGDGHFFAYRGEELADLLGKAGFNDVVVRYFETPFISGHLKLRYLHPVVPIAGLKILDRIALTLPGTRKRLAHQMLLTGCRP